MSHLHIPDGVLPVPVWLGGLLLAAFLLLLGVRGGRGAGARPVALQSTLAGVMLVIMALPVPITAFDYCMTLAGPVGVLLGAAGAMQVSFVVTLILALMGQGGFTVVGLNTLVLGLGAATARPVYLALVRPLRPAGAMAAATAVSQLLSSALWIALLWLSVRLSPALGSEHEVGHALRWVRGGVLAAVLLPLLAVAVGVESLLGYGLARVLDRVRPDLLPRPAGARTIAHEAPRS